MKKRILIITPHFYPEDFKVNDIAFSSPKDEFEIHVITCIPNYPKGRFYKGYNLFKKRIECIDNVKIFRVSVIPRGNGKSIMLFLNYLSYLITSCFWCLYLSFKYKYYKIFVHETSPITVGIPAILVKKIQKIPLYFWVLDLWPESITAASNFDNSIVLKLVNKIVVFIYNNCDKILISSNGFRESILSKGDYSEKIIYFPNWAEDALIQQSLDENVPKLPIGFNILFAGNLGEAQNLESVLQVAKMLSNFKDIHFCFVGDGRKKQWIDSYVDYNNLGETVHLYGRFPINSMPSFFKQADILLLSLKDEFIFSLTVPAKLQAYMACGKPVVGFIKGEGAAIIDESKCGISVDPNFPTELANSLLELSKIDKEQFSIMGKNGQDYYMKHFRKESRLQLLYSLLS